MHTRMEMYKNNNLVEIQPRIKENLEFDVNLQTEAGTNLDSVKLNSNMNVNMRM